MDVRGIRAVIAAAVAFATSVTLAPSSLQADANCSGVYCDDFDDGLIDDVFWYSHTRGTGASVVETDQHLEVSLQSDAAGDGAGVFAGAYVSKCRFAGDFDVHVAYTLLDWPAESGVRLELRASATVDGPAYAVVVQRIGFRSGEFPNLPRELYLFGAEGSILGPMETSHMQGRLRLVRAGNVFTGYYAVENEWVEISSTSLNVADLLITLDAHSLNSAFADQYTRISFDDFVVTSGSLSCPGGPTCGNRITEVGEDCDDGNPLDGDCCSAACGYEILGASCGNSTATSCDEPDSCDGAGTCRDNLAPEATPCNDSSTCTVNDVCIGGICAGETPVCLETGATAFQISSRVDSSKDRLRWDWVRGPEIDQIEFGSPDTTSNYALCIYDSVGDIATLVGELSLPADAVAWQNRGRKGWRYKNRSGIPDGITSVQLRPGAERQSKAQVKAGGSTTAWPVPAGPSSFFVQDSLVRIQFVNAETATCLESRFSTARRNSGQRFQANQRR